MISRITILGRFGCGNFGDDAILHSEIMLLKEKYPDAQITILSGATESFQRSFLGCSLFPMPPIMWYRFYKLCNITYTIKLLHIFQKTDLFVLGGGGFFSDRQFFAVAGRLRWVKVAHYFGAKVIGFCMGAGPFFHARNMRIIKRSATYFHSLIVRDRSSHDNLIAAGCPQSLVHTLIDPAFFTANYHAVKQPEIGFVIHDQEAYFVSQIKTLLQKSDFSVKFIIADVLDIEKNRNILNALGGDSRCSLVVPTSVQDFVSTIGSCAFVVSERLHGSIISYTQKVPFLNVYYHFKGLELVHLLGIDSFSADIKDLEHIALLDYINRLNQFPRHDINMDTYRGSLFTLLATL